MRTIQKLSFVLFAIIFMAGCGKVTYRKTAGGMPYQVYKGKGTQQVVAGNIVKAHITYKVKDSVIFNTFGKLPEYVTASLQSQPYDISEIWTTLKVGDSIIATQMMDTFIKRSPAGIPPEFKKGDKIITIIKVLEIFTSDSSANLDKLKGEQEWAVSEKVELSKYILDNKIIAEKTPSGAYVNIINPGIGNPIDSGKYVLVNYTGTSFTGKKFDSNTDTAFHHVAPYGFTVSARQMIQGFDEAVRLMKLGSKAKVYIPSMLAYAGKPNPQSGIKPYENLIFDLEIVDVKDKAPEEKPLQPDKKLKGSIPEPQK
jgi:FKBP-type peptidyl-prolyl cis-trans isomerase FkpA